LLLAYTDEELSHLTKWLSQVKTLRIRLQNLDDDDVMFYFGHSTGSTVTHLDLNNTKITDDSLISILKQCRNISTLDISHNRKLTDIGIKAVARYLQKNLVSA